MILGITPATAVPMTRARGVSPKRLTASAFASSNAQAPSLTPEELPAVTLPPGRNGVGNFAKASRLVSRGCSSTLTQVTSPRLILLSQVEKVVHDGQVAYACDAAESIEA
jgi:hypothetical protein